MAIHAPAQRPGVPAITSDKNCWSTCGRLEKRGAIQGSASKPPMVARSPGSNRATNSVTARRGVVKLATMLKLISTMIATATGTTSLRNAVISRTVPLSRTSKSSFVRSVTRWPSLSTTLAVTQIPSVALLNVACAARRADARNKTTPRTTPAIADGALANVFMTGGHVGWARVNRIAGLLDLHVNAVELVVQRRRREDPEILTMKLVHDSPRRSPHVIDWLELEGPAAGRAGQCPELTRVDSFPASDAHRVEHDPIALHTGAQRGDVHATAIVLGVAHHEDHATPAFALEGGPSRLDRIPECRPGRPRHVVTKVLHQGVPVGGQGRVQRHDMTERAETHPVPWQQAMGQFDDGGLRALSDRKQTRTSVQQDRHRDRLNSPLEQRDRHRLAVVVDLKVSCGEVRDERSARVADRRVDWKHTRTLPTSVLSGLATSN